MASLFYKTLKYCCTASLDFYFSKWQVDGVKNIPDGPVLFVPNHQNAFLDAVLISCSSKKNPWFLTRANVFNKSFAAWMLNKLQMLPIYRFRDGYATLKKNEQVFDDVVKILNQGHTVLIFAEGNHDDRYQLRPLQKGVARIAMAADTKSGVAIVPVGIQYDSRTAFRSRVLVNFGKPIFVSEMDLSHENAQNRMDALLLEIRMRLQPLLLHIESFGYEEKWTYLRQHRQYHENLAEQLVSDRTIVADYPEPGPVSSFPKPVPAWKNIIVWYLKINSVVPYFIIQKLLLDKLKDHQFGGSIKYAAGMFLAPFCWLLQAFSLYYYTGSLPLATAYFVSLPVSVKLS